MDAKTLEVTLKTHLAEMRERLDQAEARKQPPTAH